MTHIHRTPTDREIETITDVVIRVNNAYRTSIGEQPRDLEDDEIRARVRHGIRNALQHRRFDPEANHQHWCKTMEERGWKYGETEDREAQTHPDLVPYDQLPPQQRVKNNLFLSIVESMAPE